MTLADWIALSPDERNQRRRTWDRESGEWQELLLAAHSMFEAKYKSHPLINYIGYSTWQGGAYEPAILVTTALRSAQLIEELPDRFCTFAVKQEPILDVRDYYRRHWVILFSELLGWSETKTLEWAQRWEADLNGANGSGLYHEDQYWYALPEVVHQSAPPDFAFGWPRMNLVGKIEAELRPHRSEPIWQSSYDWHAARARVNRALAEVGGQLPRA